MGVLETRATWLFLTCLSVGGPARWMWQGYEQRKARLEWNHLRAVADYSNEKLPCYIKDSCRGRVNLTMVTVVAGLSLNYQQLLFRNRARFADAMCYENCIFEHPFDNTRPPAWAKVSAIRHLFNHGRTVVALLDADAVIVNHQRFESIAADAWEAGKDIVWSTDLGYDRHVHVENSSINTGVVVSRNTEWTRSFWRRIWEDFPEAIYHTWWEQQAVLSFRKRYPKEFAEHSGIVPHRVMNTGGIAEKEQADTFIYHRMGGGPTKFEYMEGYLRGFELAHRLRGRDRRP